MLRTLPLVLAIASTATVRGQDSAPQLQAAGIFRSAPKSPTGPPTASAGIVLDDDDCATTTDTIVGEGTWVFDNTQATSGAEGQDEADCECVNSDFTWYDVWFTWVAPIDGLVEMRFFADNFDFIEKPMAWKGSNGCPTEPVLTCRDSFCYIPYLNFECEAGESYLVKIGSRNGIQSTGEVDIFVREPPLRCAYQIDDDQIDESIGLNGGGRLAFLQYYEADGGSDVIQEISVTYGRDASGSTLLNGSPARVLLYDDPNDDGDPSDASLLLNLQTEVQNYNSGIPVIYSVPDIPVTGGFFVGAWVDHPDNTFPIPLDTDQASEGRSWTVWTTTGGFNFQNLAANDGPFTMAAVGFDGVLRARTLGLNEACDPLGDFFCQPLPNSTGTPGELSAVGSQTATDNALILQATGLPASQFGIFITSLTTGPAIPLSQGELCLSSDIARLFYLIAPTDDWGRLVGEVDLSSIPTSPPQAVMAGQTWYYQAWYRDGAGVSNLTNGLSINYQ